MLWSILFVLFILWLVDIVSTPILVGWLIVMGIVALVEEGVKLKKPAHPWVSEGR